LSAQTFLFQNEFEKEEEPAEQTISKAKEVKPEHIIDKHKTSPREAVVDLHIYELMEDHENIDDAQKLRTQINYFTRCLESAIANNLSKVTFIHGVGTGVLKTSIKEILKDYSNVGMQDASMKQFGYGATEVIIK